MPIAKATHYTQEAFGEKTDWFTILAATSLSADTRIKQQARGSRGMILLLNVASAATLSVTPRIETVDDAGNVVILWSAAAAVIANGVVVYVFADNGATDMNGSGVTAKALMPIPREWQLFLDFSTGSATIDAHLCYL